jgi:hypothetical protein
MTNSAAIFNTMLHEIGHTFGLDHCPTCPQGSSIMTAFAVDCSCPSSPCDQNVPYNGTRFGCPPLQAPRDCDINTVAQRANYPPPPSPTPTPLDVGGGGGGGGVCQYDDTGCEDCVPDDGLAWQNCRNLEAYWAIFPTCGCSDPSPILVDLSGNGFNLTNRANGVMFDLNNDGIKNHIQWTSALTDDAWLCLDRDGNSTIDNGGELFGNFTPQPEPPLGQERNGFLALAEYDKPSNGGNGDGLITEADTIFGSLRLWQDVNHDGISDADELFQLRLANVATLELGYKTSKYIDAYGNEFRYRAKIKDAKGAQVGRWMWDVYLVRVP